MIKCLHSAILCGAVLSAVLLSGCSEKSTAPAAFISSARTEPQQIVSLPLWERPEMRLNLAAADKYYPPLDADSIEMFAYRGGTYYHPVNMTQRIYAFTAAYIGSGDARYLRRAEKTVEKLLSLCLEQDGALWAPYRFRYAVHSDSSITFAPPWFSGMAQGGLLGNLSRLYLVSGNERYRRAADSVFKSFLQNRGSQPWWFMRVDSAGYLWIEEYPHDNRPGRTPNGMMYAMYGLYEYWLATHDSTARALWDATVTTLKHYLPEIRRPGKNSYYCLGHMVETSDAYHRLHINMLAEFYRMTGDDYFDQMRQSFQDDTSSEN